MDRVSNGIVSDLEITQLTNADKVAVQLSAGKPATLALLDKMSQPLLYEAGTLKGMQVVYSTVPPKGGRPELAAAIREVFAAGAASQAGVVVEPEAAPAQAVQPGNSEAAIIAKLKQNPVIHDSAPLNLQDKTEIQKDTARENRVTGK